MSEIVDFLTANAYEIVIIVIVILCLLVLINLKGLDLNASKPESKLVQEVTVETFDTEEERRLSLKKNKEYLDAHKDEVDEYLCQEKRLS